ncbi:MAG: hypothetical protein GXY48_08435 [Methanomicrobiales archaeon]|nr:hypothetical protein [Methanomicrobiales archaeon]
MCYETTSETTDDIRIEIRGPGIEKDWGGKGGHDMKDGDSWVINEIIENPENQQVLFLLYEDDSPYQKSTNSLLDDLIGRFTIPPEVGVFTRDLPDILSSPHTTHYQISYEVGRDTGSGNGTLPHTYYLTIQSVKCNDAQESRDEIFIKINDENVWEEHNLKSGETKWPSPQYITVPTHVKMEVWERDTSSSDRIGTYEFDIYNSRFNSTLNNVDIPQSHVFKRDSGIVGDAKYTVAYIISQNRE